MIFFGSGVSCMVTFLRSSATVSSHVYLPVSEVARGEKVRVSPSVEILSEVASTTLPLTIQVTTVCMNG